ncbi:MAG: thioredoxin family protein [Planctomycetota bacterium]|nr:thioredoxin family protein [Planctomycetota bacterium]
MKWMQSLHRMILGAVLVAVAAPLVAQDRVPWITDLRQAREVAERQNRLVLLHFWREDCPPCKQLERNVFNRPEFVRSLTTGYVPVKINSAEQPRLVEFYNIVSVPTDVIVTPEGREVQRFPSAQDSNQYIAMLDGIRARASVGVYEPIAPNATPVATRPQQSAANAGTYGGFAPSQAEPSRYGQGGVGLPACCPPEPASTPDYAQNRFANPLGQQTAPQQQELAPRYANPYGQDPSASNNATGSRWGQPTQGYGSGAANRTQQAAVPQANEFVGPSETNAPGSQGASLEWPKDRAASQYRGAQNQVVQNQPTQNPTLGAPAPQRGYGEYDVAAQQRPAMPQPPPNTSQPQISLEGYCPVMLIQNRVWTPGDKKWGAVHEGRVYLFAGPEEQTQFLANPHVYAPLMAGYDPVRFAETGQLVPGRREFGLYIGEPGPIALFADEAALKRFHDNAGYYFDRIRQAKMQQSGRVTR